MPWVWSDELATRLMEAGIVEPGRLDDASTRPVAFAVDDPNDLVRLGQDLLGLEVREPIVS